MHPPTPGVAGADWVGRLVLGGRLVFVLLPSRSVAYSSSSW